MDFLHWDHLRDQVRIIEGSHSVNESHVVNALVEIASSLYAAQYMGSAPASRRDLYIINEVLAVLTSISDALVERFDMPAVHMAMERHHHVDRQRQAGPSVHSTWKPAGRLWTAPLVEPSSAWELWAKNTGNARAWNRQLRYESPARQLRVVVDSLASADELIGRRSFKKTAQYLEDNGIRRIDFSWRCALEAECSILRAERTPISYPCGLGTESSVWLRTPEPTIELKNEATTLDDQHVALGWFIYG